MKGFLIFLFGIAWLMALYYGYTLIVTKTLNSAPSKEKTMDESRQEKTQRQKAQDNIQKQRQLMEDRQRTLRYHQSR